MFGLRSDILKRGRWRNCTDCPAVRRVVCANERRTSESVLNRVAEMCVICVIRSVSSVIRKIRHEVFLLAICRYTRSVTRRIFVNFFFFM